MLRCARDTASPRLVRACRLIPRTCVSSPSTPHWKPAQSAWSTARVTVLPSETIGRGHAERLMGMIEAAMEEAGLGLRRSRPHRRHRRPRLVHRLARRHRRRPRPGARDRRTGRRHRHARRPCRDRPPRDRRRAGACRACRRARRDLRPELRRRRHAGGSTRGRPGRSLRPACRRQHADRRLRRRRRSPKSSATRRAPAPSTRRSAPDIASLCRLGARRRRSTGEAPRPLYLRPPDAKPQTAGRIARQ